MAKTEEKEIPLHHRKRGTKAQKQIVDEMINWAKEAQKKGKFPGHYIDLVIAMHKYQGYGNIEEPAKEKVQKTFERRSSDWFIALTIYDILRALEWCSLEELKEKISII